MINPTEKKIFTIENQKCCLYRLMQNMEFVFMLYIQVNDFQSCIIDDSCLPGLNQF